VPALEVEIALHPPAAAVLRAGLLEGMAEVCRAVRAQPEHRGLRDMLLAVRVGPLAQGEVGFAVVAAAERRQPAVEAMSMVVDHLHSIELK
jgi:molybdopterin synthase catalytic subunit